MTQATAPQSSGIVRIVFVISIPFLVLAGTCMLAAHRAARVWPAVDTPPLASSPPALSACGDSGDRLERLVRSATKLDVEALEPAFDPERGPTPEQHALVEQAAGVERDLDSLLACGAVALGAPEAGILGRRLNGLSAAARVRLLRAWTRSDGGDPDSGARDLASVMRFGAVLEHAGSELRLSEIGVAVGLLALDEVERWLDVNPEVSDVALSVLAEELAGLGALPDGVTTALVWDCRLQEHEIANLGVMPTPEKYLSQAGLPYWAGWLSGWLPVARTFDAPLTLAMHRLRCASRLDAVRAGGLWDDADLGPGLWDREQLSLGAMMDNPIGRSLLERPPSTARINALILADRTLRSRRVLLATHVALERGSRAHDGQLPSHLELLVPDFLSAVPIDPVDGKPINWVRSHGEVFTSREVPGPDGQAARLLIRVPER